MNSLANLPIEILLKIRQHLRPSQLVHVGQTCESLHEPFVSLPWTDIGYFPQNYIMKGTHFKFSETETFEQCSPKIPNDVLSGRSLELDKLTFLLMNNLVSDRALSYIKTVTICAGYDIGRMTPDKGGNTTCSSFGKQFHNKKNAWALFDTAILEIYACYPRIDEAKLELYTQLFADTGRLQTWLMKLRQAKTSIQKTTMFTSTFLRGRRLRVGPQKNKKSGEIISVMQGSSSENSSNFDYANALATNEFSFAEFIATKLLQFPNLNILAIDAHDNMGADPDNAHTKDLYSTRAECLLSSISRVLPKLPNVEVRLSLHGRLLHGSFFSTNNESLSQIKIVRFECYDNRDHYLHGISFLKMLKISSGVEKLEVLTTNDPSSGNPRSDNALYRAVFTSGRDFVLEIAALPDNGTATDIALCSQYLTSTFHVMRLINDRYRVAQYTLTLDYRTEVWALRHIFHLPGAAMKRLKIILTKKYELPPVTRMGLKSLQVLELEKFSLCPQVKECFKKANPWLEYITN